MILLFLPRLYAPVASGAQQDVGDVGIPAVLVMRRVRPWRSARFRFRRGPN